MVLALVAGAGSRGLILCLERMRLTFGQGGRHGEEELEFLLFLLVYVPTEVGSNVF